LRRSSTDLFEPIAVQLSDDRIGARNDGHSPDPIIRRESPAYQSSCLADPSPVNEAIPRQHTGDDDELLREIIGIFLEESTGQLSGLTHQVNKGDSPGALRTIHSLKGSLAHIGAQVAAELGRKLEGAARRGDQEAVAGLLPDLTFEFHRVRPVLEA